MGQWHGLQFPVVEHLVREGGNLRMHPAVLRQLSHHFIISVILLQQTLEQRLAAVGQQYLLQLLLHHF